MIKILSTDGINLLKDLVSIRSKKYGYSFSTSKLPMRFLIFLFPSKFEIKHIKKAINIFIEADLKDKIEIIKRLKLIFKSLFIKLELFVLYNQRDPLPTLFQKISIFFELFKKLLEILKKLISLQLKLYQKTKITF